MYLLAISTAKASIAMRIAQGLHTGTPRKKILYSEALSLQTMKAKSLAQLYFSGTSAQTDEEIETSESEAI